MEMLGTKTPKPFFKRWWFIALAAFVLLGLFINLMPKESPESGSDGSVALTTTSSAPTTTTEPIAPWRSLLEEGMDADEFLLTLCEPLESDIDEMSDTLAERLALSEEPAKDSYASAEFLDEISSWGSYSQDFVAQVQQIGVARDLLDEVKIAEPRDEQLTELLDEARGKCELTTSTDFLFIAAKALDKRIGAIKTRAKNLPWYPKDFRLFESNIAYRFLESSEHNCTYSGSRCWGVEIVTQTGCSNLYAEITILDSSDRNIGWTNDTATNVRPNERVALTFDSFEDGADKARLSEVTCY